MAENTKIEWAHHTFNPWVGCTKVSPACDHCYAASWAARVGHPELWNGSRRRTSAANWLLPLKWNRQAEAGGHRWRVFCASLADVFDNQAESEWRADLFELIRVTPHLDWMLLTKRIGNAVDMVLRDGAVAGNGSRYLPENVWLGATIANQVEAERDIPKLLHAKAELGARIAFLSCEPMLGPVWPWTSSILDEALRLIGDDPPSLDLVIAGGESGSGARPMHPAWPRALRDHCRSADCAFFFKQWGDWLPKTQPVFADQDTVFFHTGRGRQQGWLTTDGLFESTVSIPAAGSEPMVRVGKKEAGRMLDNMTHDGMPA